MFGLNVNIEGIGYVSAEYKRKSLHDVKSLAGKAFHKDHVKSVCVFDETGTARLYLKRLENGKYHREER